MKFALLTSNGEAVALASRLIAAGASACTAQTGAPLPASDWLLFDESVPLASPADRAETKRLLGEALSAGHPVFAFLSPAAPASPKCAVVMTELLGYSSAAAVTPFGASQILGLDGDPDADPKIAETLGDDEELCRFAALAKELAETYDLPFTLVFDPDGERGILFAGDAYDTVTAESIEGAIAELFRSAA